MPEHDWEAHYRSGQPPWENGEPSRELARVIAEDEMATGRVLELGCGSGINAVWLAQQGFDVTAVDITPLAIDQARDRAEAAGVEVRFLLADVLDLSEEFEPFPFIFDRGCYHAVRNIDAAAYVRTLQRVTEPGSLALLLTGNAREPHEPGPPVVAEEDFHAELEPAFEIVRLREFRFDSLDGPLAWSCLLRRVGDRGHSPTSTTIATN